MNRNCRPVQRGAERGSALLIVFLFAAVLAISLYMEMPVVAFEAKRAKEQLLVDRGTEYAHAVKLYYRKFRSYPASIDQLENTNRMRFLRHRFKDPITGQDNWRLLHAGPGGQLTDSKVNPIGLNANANSNGQSSGTGTNSGTNNNSFGSTNNSSFANNSTSASFMGSAAAKPSNTAQVQPAADNGTGVATVAGVPQRPPEMPVNGGAASNPANGDPTQSLLPGSAAGPFVQTQPNQTQPNQTQMIQPGMVPGAQPIGMSAIPAQPMSQAQAAANGASISSPTQSVQGLFGNPNPAGASGNTATSAPMTNPATTIGGTGATAAFVSSGTNTSQSNTGTLQSGGIAGVASIAKGSTIKTVNDQTDYSLWEFYYDPTKDTTGTAQSGINPLAGAPQSNAAGAAPTASTANSTQSTAPNTSARPPGVIATPPQQP
jgi:hypothetical protein